MTTHPHEDDLVLFHYAEADDARAIEAHVAACAACREALLALRTTLAAVPDIDVPSRNDAYGTRVWRRLEPQLPRRAPRARYAAWGALAASLLLAFLLGRHYPARSAVQALSAPVRERVLLVAVGDHLERSQTLLVELTHATPEDVSGLAGERAQAEELAGESRLYRQAAVRSGDAGVADVLDELERVLVEIAHSPKDLTAPELARIQRRIESKGILFKVRVLGSQVRARENQAARTSAAVS